MNPITLLLPALFLALCVPCQDPSPGTGSLFRRTKAQPAEDALIGAWNATGEPERLEFRRSGVLLVDGSEMRYRVAGGSIWIETQGQTLTGTWRISGVHLTITLRLPDGTTQSEQYARETPPERVARPAAGQRVGAGCVTLELPRGWSIARGNDDGALLDLGLREPETLDAMVLVLTGDLPDEARQLSAADLLASRIDAIAVEVADLQVEIDASTAEVRGLGRGEGAELTVRGTSGGQHPVSVWVGVTRDATRFAGVLAIMVRGREDRFLPGARSVMNSLQFVAAGPRPKSGEDGGRGTGGSELAGLEFGDATHGSDAHSTTTYAFAANGTMRRRHMFSSPVGGSDKTVRGTYHTNGDVVTIHIDGEEIQARIERSDAGIAALRVGNRRFPRC